MSCDPKLRQELQVIYSELQREIQSAGPACQLSGRCCRFDEYGHTLFLSTLEAEWFLEEGLPPNAPIIPERCPFQKGKLCTNHERRPLGCRVFYCDPSYQERSAEISERYVRRLKDLAVALEKPWSYAPLHRILSEYRGRSAKPLASALRRRKSEARNLNPD